VRRSEACRLPRAIVIIDTLHPIYEGERFAGNAGS
jgi:hypothetical protein